MELEEIEELIKLIQSGRNLTPPDRVNLLTYLRNSAPMAVVMETEQPVLNLIRECEEDGHYLQLTHAARNALTKLYGYQVLQLI